MRVLFCDFDGVLNSKQHFLAIASKKIKGADTLNDANLFAMKRDINPNNIWVLDYILKQVPDLKIVISSAWGAHYSISEFKELFKIFKLDHKRLIGITPRKISSSRCNEINWWIAEYEETHHDKVDWVAVDDHIIFNLDDKDKFREHLTDPWVGLTMRDAEKIIRHFYPLSDGLPVIHI